MISEENEEKFDQMQFLKQSSLYRNFSGLNLEIKRLYLKLFEENIKETIQLQNQKQTEISQTFSEYINQEYQIYSQDLQQQNIEPHEYVFEQSFIPYLDEIDNDENNHNVHTQSHKKIIKIINQGDLDLYEQCNLFKETIQIDIIKLNNKNIMQLQLFKIITFQDQQEIIQERFQYFLKFKNENDNYKYNQNISDPEYKILSNHAMMLNTNIIDGYMNYLQIQDEINYFSLSPQKRQQYQRLILFPSSLVTNCTFKQFEIKDQELMKKKIVCHFLDHIKQFSAIQYKFWLIYKKIGIVVNSSNFHWQFIEVKVDQRVLVLYDSLFTQLSIKVEYCLNTIFQTLTKDKNFEFKVIKQQNFPKQIDGTSCGYFTCIAANYLSQLQSDQSPNFKLLFKMKQELLELFFFKKTIEKQQ